MPSLPWQLLQVPCSVTHQNTPAEICILNVFGKREEGSWVTAACSTEMGSKKPQWF